MQEKVSPKFPDPAASPFVSPFQAFDLVTLSAIQTQNVEALQRISALVLDASNMIAARHADYLATSRDQAEHWFDRNPEFPGIGRLGEHRAAIYTELSTSLARHTEDLMEITMKCCSDALQQVGENATEQSDTVSKCCCGPSHQKDEDHATPDKTDRSKKSSGKTRGQPAKVHAA